MQEKGGGGQGQLLVVEDAAPVLPRGNPVRQPFRLLLGSWFASLDFLPFPEGLLSVVGRLATSGLPENTDAGFPVDMGQAVTHPPLATALCMVY